MDTHVLLFINLMRRKKLDKGVSLHLCVLLYRINVRRYFYNIDFHTTGLI